MSITSLEGQEANTGFLQPKGGTITKKVPRRPTGKQQHSILFARNGFPNVSAVSHVGGCREAAPAPNHPQEGPSVEPSEHTARTPGLSGYPGRIPPLTSASACSSLCNCALAGRLPNAPVWSGSQLWSWGVQPGCPRWKCRAGFRAEDSGENRCPPAWVAEAAGIPRLADPPLHHQSQPRPVVLTDPSASPSHLQGPL